MSATEWVPRRPVGRAAGNAVSDLRSGMAPDAVGAHRGLSAAQVEGIRTFYDLIEPGPRWCDGTACRFAPGAVALRRRTEDRTGIALGTVRCLGRCYAAPAMASADRAFTGGAIEAWSPGILDGQGAPPPDDPALEIPCVALAQSPIVLRHLVPGHRRPAPAGQPRAVDYALPDGDTILAAVAAAGLRGRGGAAYPTAEKWRAARESPAAERWVVANGDEGDPGAFVDRLLLEQDPHAVLAGLAACARAVGARYAIVYVRAEYPRARAVVQQAIDAVAARELVPGLEMSVVSGAGSYVCGEETALLESIEGRRGEPRLKPPYPAQSGLWGMPTVVQNVETLAVVGWIASRRGPARTKVLSVSGAVARPGAIEIDWGTPLRDVLERGAGGPAAGRRWKMALVGGPLGRVLPESGFDVPVDFERLPGLGHGGIVVLDETVSARSLAEHLFEFARAESCGSCAPCRLGTARLAAAPDRAALVRLLDTLGTGSRCGFGLGVPRPVHDLLEHFGAELFP